MNVTTVTSTRLVGWVSGILLAAAAALWAARWPDFPLFLDPYYHAFIAQQVRDAGGPIAYDWWSWAPEGRVHLYPPLLHLLLAAGLQGGLGVLTVLRLASVLMLPALVASIWFVARRLFGAQTALACILMACTPFAWWLHLTGTLASPLALIELLWFLAALAAGRWFAAAVLLGLLFYTHLGLPWVAIASAAAGAWLGGFGAPRKSGDTILFPIGNSIVSPDCLWKALGLGLVVAVPRLWLLGAHWSQFRIQRLSENAAMEFQPALWALAAFGAWQAWRLGGRWRLLLGLWLGFGLMVYPFTYRWIVGEGLLPVILLSGVGLAAAAARLSRWRSGPATGWILALAALVWAGPTVHVELAGAEARSASAVRWQWPDAGPWHLLQYPGVTPKGNDIRLTTPLTEQLAETVASVSRPGEIVWANAPYAGGLVAVLARRAMSSAMFGEVPPSPAYDPIGAAHVVLWFKVGAMPGVPPLSEVRSRYRLVPAAEDGLAVVFRNSSAGALAAPPRAVIPFTLAGVLLCVAIGLLVWDLRRGVWHG